VPASAANATGGNERYVILAIERGGSVMPMSMAVAPRRGDEATVAVHVPERDEALRLLEAAGWWALPEMVDDEQGDGAEAAAAPPEPA